MLEYHTFLHHSQTITTSEEAGIGLSTIRFYIILKLIKDDLEAEDCLSTIRFYIILKPPDERIDAAICLSTIRFYIILKL